MIDVVIQTKFDCIDHTGDRFECMIQIGRPHQIPTGEWACPVAMLGLEKRLPDVRGEDSLQAVCLALTLVRRLLTDFVEDGGRILFPAPITNILWMLLSQESALVNCSVMDLGQPFLWE